MRVGGPADFFEMDELLCSDQAMRQFNNRQHIPIDIDTSDAFCGINHKGKINDYNQLSYHETYISH